MLLFPFPLLLNGPFLLQLQLMMKQLHSLTLSFLISELLSMSISLSQSNLNVQPLLMCYLLLSKQVMSQLISLCLLCIQCTILHFCLCLKVDYVLMKLCIELPILIISNNIGICSRSRHWNLCLSIMPLPTVSSPLIVSISKSIH